MEEAALDVAARLEASGLPGRVQCSEEFAAAAAWQAPDVVLALRYPRRQSRAFT